MGSGLVSKVLTGGGRGQGNLLDQPISSYPLQKEQNSEITCLLCRSLSLQQATSSAPPLCGGGVCVHVSEGLKRVRRERCFLRELSTVILGVGCLRGEGKGEGRWKEGEVEGRGGGGGGGELSKSKYE